VSGCDGYPAAMPIPISSNERGKRSCDLLLAEPLYRLDWRLRAMSESKETLDEED